jgi:hypothetical protein
MTVFRAVSLALAIAAVSAGADKDKKYSGKGSNDVVELTASAIMSRDTLKTLLGSDLDGYYIVVDVTLTPKLDEIAVSRDNFLLRTDKDGERTTPFAPSQIAGSGVLVVSSTGGGRAVMGEDRGPVWGGYPTGRPGRLGGDGGSIGNSAESSAQATVTSADKKKDPLLDTLEAKILPEKKTGEPVSGLLYFPLSIKQKVKDLELIYTSTAGKVSLRFK